MGLTGAGGFRRKAAAGGRKAALESMSFVFSPRGQLTEEGSQPGAPGGHVLGDGAHGGGGPWWGPASLEDGGAYAGSTHPHPHPTSSPGPLGPLGPLQGMKPNPFPTQGSRAAVSVAEPAGGTAPPPRPRIWIPGPGPCASCERLSGTVMCVPRVPQAPGP